MSSRIEFLTELERKNCRQVKKEVSRDFIHDVLFWHLQTLYNREIVDIDIGLPDLVPMKIYLRKEGRKKLER